MVGSMRKQRCLRDRVYSFDIESHTDPDIIYEVIILDNSDPDEAICECESYEFRGYCRHQQEAFDLLCDWETNATEHQTPAQRRHHICPRCGSRTTWSSE